MAHAVQISAQNFNSHEGTNREIFTDATCTMEKCKFNALSALQGTKEETSGGAMYCKNCQLTFTSCMFSGNTAIIGGAVAFEKCQISANKCNFTNNKAMNEAGAVILDGCGLEMDECFFVRNTCEISIGVLKATDCKINGEGLIFQDNAAPFQASVVLAEKSTISLVGSQFAANVLSTEVGFAVADLVQSTMKLSGCRFDTSVSTAQKRPIKVDVESKLTAVGCCFDVTEEDLRAGGEGTFELKLSTTFGSPCPCKPVTIPIAFDILNIDVKVKSELMTSQFLTTIMVLIGAVALITVVLTFGDSKKSDEWVQLL